MEDLNQPSGREFFWSTIKRQWFIVIPFFAIAIFLLIQVIIMLAKPNEASNISQIVELGGFSSIIFFVVLLVLFLLGYTISVSFRLSKIIRFNWKSSSELREHFDRLFNLLNLLEMRTDVFDRNYVDQIRDIVRWIYAFHAHYSFYNPRIRVSYIMPFDISFDRAYENVTRIERLVDNIREKTGEIERDVGLLHLRHERYERMIENEFDKLMAKLESYKHNNDHTQYD